MKLEFNLGSQKTKKNPSFKMAMAELLLVSRVA
jgi:hypothetical protein